jgi:excisionase family DNA binding protein
MLGISETAVYQAARQDRIPVRRWGRKMVFLADELEQWMATLPRAMAVPALE